MGGGLSLPLFKPSPLLGMLQEIEPPSRPPGDGVTMLFFDDEPLFSRSKVVRRLGQPQRVAAYHEAAGNCTWGRPAVFRWADGTWRMIYQAGVGKPNQGGGIVLLAASTDGREWLPCDTTQLVEIPDRVASHQLMPSAMGSYCSAFEDSRAEPGERYKLLSVQENRHAVLWTSPDLLRWTQRPERPWHPRPPDPPAFMFWNEVAGKYMITARPEWPDRRVCLIETGDWHDFTMPRLALQADADDRDLAQHYGMYVLPYKGYYIGLLWIYYAGDAAASSAPNRYRGGKLETYLAYSLNGVHWQRCFHTPLFRNGAASDPDAGLLQVANIISLDDGTLRAYAACSRNEHGICPPNDGHIVTYELRRDGFVCLEAGEETGLVSTRALFWRGGEAAFNLEAPRGEVRVRIVEARGRSIPGYGFEDCEPLIGDDVSWTPRWRGGLTLSALAGRMIRLEVSMRDTRLYSVGGDFVLSRLLEVERWEKERIQPVLRLGF